MLLEAFNTISYSTFFIGVYLVLGGFMACNERVVWLPVTLVVPLLLLVTQGAVFLQISHEYQLIALLALLAGLGFGGTMVRPQVLAVLPQFRFKLAGEWVTLALIVIIFSVRLLAATGVQLMPESAGGIGCASAAIGAFIAGSFLGRALFLTSTMRKKRI